jgi:hypothetical protein
MISRTCFAEAKFNVERKLAELGIPLDPRLLQIGLHGNGRSVTIVHPSKPGWAVIENFALPDVINNPADLDADFYRAQFEQQPEAH